jgi:hypothetical protein
MTPARARREKAKHLALQFGKQYEELVTASGQQAIEFAAIRLGDTFNTNAEFILNVLREYGGLQPHFEKIEVPAEPAPPPPTPAIFLVQDNDK